MASPQPAANHEVTVGQPADLYLDLLKKVLTRSILPDVQRPLSPPVHRGPRLVWTAGMAALAAGGLKVVRQVAVDPTRRAEGRDWPAEAETMIGLQRLDNLHRCIKRIVEDGVPGDLMETGVWRGGATIFMRAALEAYGDRDRSVWVVDSFAGLPRPDPTHYPLDAGVRLWDKPALAISLDQVKANFARFGMLDDRVRFLVGWFKDTLPTAPVERLAVLRLDGDMYESTMDVLTAMYDKLSPGGYLIVDDWGVAPNCKAAVRDFRARHGITEEILQTDWTEVYWRKAG